MDWRMMTPSIRARLLPVLAGPALVFGILLPDATLGQVLAPPPPTLPEAVAPTVPAPGPTTPRTPAPTTPSVQIDDRTLPGGPSLIADLAERVLPSVVNIASTQIVSANRSPGQQTPEPPIGELFDDFFNRPEGDPSRRVESLGSGFIVDPAGIVVTNFHVVDGADEILVNLHDGTRLIAELVGRDTKTDLAVLRVQPTRPLPALTFATSEEIRIGDWVIAIGNPFGLGGSVSVGILSARNRDINTGPYDDFLQTDAAINRGNSGGPLLNMNGEVVGVTTAIISPTGASVGIGFAVPAEMATHVVDQLVEFGETRRGLLGVRIQDVTIDIADGLGMERAQGALISGVNTGSPAEVAGMQLGDVVTEFGGIPINEMRDLPRMVASSPIGEPIDITVLRDGAEVALSVRLERMVEEGNTAVAAMTPLPPRSLGLTLGELDEATRRAHNIPAEVQGVVVTAVAEGSAAAEKGVEVGDVILEIAQEPVMVPADVETRFAALRESDRRAALILLSGPDGETRFVALRLD